MPWIIDLMPPYEWYYEKVGGMDYYAELFTYISSPLSNNGDQQLGGEIRNIYSQRFPL